MEKTAVYNLGLVLGLSQHQLKANIDSKSFLDDVISAWLRREDQVIKRGKPSRTILISALMHRRVRQTGIATKIAKNKNVSVQFCNKELRYLIFWCITPIVIVAIILASVHCHCCLTLHVMYHHLFGHFIQDDVLIINLK